MDKQFTDNWQPRAACNSCLHINCDMLQEPCASCCWNETAQRIASGGWTICKPDE